MDRTRHGRLAAPASGPLEPPGGATLAMVVLAGCVGQFLVVLDVSVVNVALASIRQELGLHRTGLQWVVNAYVLTFAGFLLLGGRVADLYGRKRMFLVGLGVFTLGSLAGGLAQQPWQLVGARALQGLGAAVLAPASLSLITSSIPEGHRRTRAIGTWTAVGAAGGAAGALVGGLLTDLLSWRWVLLVNVPVGVLVIAAAVLWLPESRGVTGRRLDLPGAMLITAGIGSLAYGVVQTESAGWTSSSALAPMLAGLVGIGLFLLVEARSREPLMPLRVFRLRTVSAANAATLLCASGTFAMWYFMSTYLQDIRGYSAIDTGLAFLPHTVATATASKLGPRLMRWIDGRLLAITGGLIVAAGLYGQSVALTSDGSYLVAVAAPGVAICCGTGLLMTPLTIAATTGADPSDAGLVAGLVNTSRQIGATLGLATLATVAASGPTVLAGYADAFRVAAAVVLVSVVVMALALPRVRRRSAVHLTDPTADAMADPTAGSAASTTPTGSG